MIREIRVEMLGGLSVWADGASVLDHSAKVNKPWQVFSFLVLNRGAPIAPARLISAIWPDENLSDPGNVLKNTIYALRREFKTAGSTRESPILFEGGGYICNPDITFVVDVDEFEQKCNALLQADDDQKMSLLAEAAALYRGELLPELDSEIWVMPLAVYYRKRFTDSELALCEMLYTHGRYSELLQAATAANRIDPLEELYYLYIFRALYKLEMYRVIIPTYHKTARIFAEELGASLSGEITEIYQAASERVDQIEQDIMIIKDDLREVTHDSRTVQGPLYCTYDVFKYLYQMIARSADRTGNRIVIVLLSLQQEGGGQPAAKTLSAAMNQMKTLIIEGLLRKSDTVARYSKSQFIIMLSVDRPDGAEVVMDRIQKRCDCFLAPNRLKIVFATTELEPMSP